MAQPNLFKSLILQTPGNYFTHAYQYCTKYARISQNCNMTYSAGYSITISRLCYMQGTDTVNNLGHVSVPMSCIPPFISWNSCGQCIILSRQCRRNIKRMSYSLNRYLTGNISQRVNWSSSAASMSRNLITIFNWDTIIAENDYQGGLTREYNIIGANYINKARPWNMISWE